MADAAIRPWGRLDWILSRISKRSWNLLGAVSFEDRCLACWELLKASSHQLASTHLVRIREPFASTNPHSQQSHRRIDARCKDFFTLGGKKESISEHNLLASDLEIAAVAHALVQSAGESIILDISCLPKRFFFPLLVKCLESRAVRDLLVTYTIPIRYGKVLAENANMWAALPMFGPTPRLLQAQPVLIVGVGYEPLNILEILEGRNYQPENVRFILPFPSKPPGIEKNWRFLLHVERQLTRLHRESIRRVHPYDVPAAFDEIVGQTNGGVLPAVLAPYGPKTVSLAMALFGCYKRAKNEDVEIGYTQPKIYRADYSSGVELEDSRSKILTYFIRTNGRDIYAIP